MPDTYTYVTPLPGWGAVPVVIRSSDEAYIPCDLDNRDYQRFLAEIAAGEATAPEGWTGPTNATPTG